MRRKGVHREGLIGDTLIYINIDNGLLLVTQLQPAQYTETDSLWGGLLCPIGLASLAVLEVSLGPLHTQVSTAVDPSAQQLWRAQLLALGFYPVQVFGDVECHVHREVLWYQTHIVQTIATQVARGSGRQPCKVPRNSQTQLIADSSLLDRYCWNPLSLNKITAVSWTAYSSTSFGHCPLGRARGGEIWSSEWKTDPCTENCGIVVQAEKATERSIFQVIPLSEIILEIVHDFASYPLFIGQDFIGIHHSVVVKSVICSDNQSWPPESGVTVHSQGAEPGSSP